MTSYGYIIMITVDSCIILYYLDWIMQLKLSHYIATNVCSRKGATTFGDLPDCIWEMELQSTQVKSNLTTYLKIDFRWFILFLARWSNKQFDQWHALN